MGFWLLLGLAALPIIEIALFIWVGGAIGVLPTIALVILAGMLGMAVIRRQGVQAMDRLRASLEAANDPGPAIAHGALVLVAGVLLLIPGFLTDMCGLLLLLPPVRDVLIRAGAARPTVRVATYVRRGPAGAQSQPRPQSGPVETIDAEYEVVAQGSQPRGTSGWTRPEE